MDVIRWILVLLGFGFLVANARLAIQYLQYRRRVRSGALLTWLGPKPPYYLMALAIGVVLGLLVMVNLYFGRPVFGEVMMFIYYAYLFPLSRSIQRGFYEDGIWADTAFIPYNEVGERLGEFPQDRSAEILVYCRSGSMSTQASQVLAAAGYTNVKNLIGGVQAWRESHQGIELTPETVDLGTVVYGEVARTQFILTNTTPNPLTITRVSTSCTCTKAQVQKTLLKPYETTVVDVSFDPAVHKDDTDLGDITRTIYIETDNINAKKIDSSITAHVIKDNS